MAFGALTLSQVGVQKWCQNIICLENELSKQKQAQ
jgi:hypothetical protein